MSQPAPYSPAHSFVSDSATLANFPGQSLDIEFNDIKTTTDQILANLALIQRDDGAPKNGSVTFDSLSPALQSNGLAAAASWLTATNYLVGTTVYQNSNLYRCLIAHTANVFATDLAAGNWLLLVALPVGPTGAAGINGTNGTNGTNGAVSISGTPSAGQIPSWTNATTLKATTINGLVKGNGASDPTAAVAGTDYLAPAAIGVTIQAFDAQLTSNIPQNSKSANYTTVLTDAEKHLFHPDADTTARTFTIDSNTNVAYQVGTTITFVNGHGAGVITIAITSDLMRLAGTGATGSRTLAADGMATAIKITATEWKISGVGLN